jgi:hypothetical protein
MIDPLLPILIDHMLYFIKLYFVILLISIFFAVVFIFQYSGCLPVVKCVLIDCRSISAGDYQLCIESFTHEAPSDEPQTQCDEKLYQEALINALGELKTICQTTRR